MPKCMHARSLASADTEALERADPTGWANRIRKILACPALVSLVVILATVLVTLCCIGWKRVASIEQKADTAATKAAEARHRTEIIDEKINRIDENVHWIRDQFTRTLEIEGGL